MVTAALPAQDHGRTALRLLLAEDSEDDAELLLYALGKAGFDVDCQRVDSEPGLCQALAQARWDLVISDHNMPGFSGSRALSIVHGQAPGLPFLFVSANPSEETLADDQRLGVSRSFIKGKLAGLGPAILALLAAARRQGSG
jgi:CheY-like chemotaxis protein